MTVQMTTMDLKTTKALHDDEAPSKLWLIQNEQLLKKFPSQMVLLEGEVKLIVHSIFHKMI